MNINIYGHSRHKGYELIGEKQMRSVGYTSNKPENNSLKLNLIKIAITVVIIFILISIFIKHLRKINRYKISNFQEIFPKTNLDSNNSIVDINELFYSRRLYINNKSITNDYIDFLRPINQEEEKKYRKVLHPNATFNDYPSTKKERQFNVDVFFNLTNKETLIESDMIQTSDKPNISIIIPLINKKPEIVRSINSILYQTFKNIEIIIVDDSTSEDNSQTLEYLYKNEPRIRIFKHSNKMGIWRSRMDGFLYSNGNYILHFEPGDIFADNYALEDIFNLAKEYNLDTVRFSFSKNFNNDVFLKNPKFNNKKIYPEKYTKIIYGRPDYDVHSFGYGTLFNRLVRKSLFRKGLDLVDEYILNANKNLWEDMWWNDLIDRVSFSNLIVNRLGYILFYNRDSPGEPKVRTGIDRDKMIREFILFWFFDYQLLPKNDNKAKIIEILRNFNKKDNKFCRLPMSLYYLNSNFPILDHFLLLLSKDQYISKEDRKFVIELYKNSPKNK